MAVSRCGGPRVTCVLLHLLRDRLFAPAGYAFAIWGVIYIGEVCGAVLAFRRKASVDVAWCAANMSQCLWCLAFRPWALDKLWLSTGLLGTTALCLWRSQSDRACGGSSASGDSSGSLAYWMVMFPRSLHLGWVTAATLVNVNAFVGYSSWGGESRTIALFPVHADAAFSSSFYFPPLCLV